MSFSTTIIIFAVCVFIYGALRYNVNRTALVLIKRISMDKYWDGSLGVETFEHLYQRTNNHEFRVKINFAILQIRASMAIIGIACFVLLAFGFTYWR